jgi:hypothetical protein
MSEIYWREVNRVSEEELLKMDISKIVDGNFYRETLIELKLEKEKEIDKIKIEAFTRRKEIVKNKVESDLYNEMYQVSGKRATLYLEKYKISFELYVKLNDEFNIDNEYNSSIFSLNNEIETIDKIIKRV